MGTGYHGGFGNTLGSRKIDVVSASSAFVGKGEGESLKNATKWIKEEPGFTDVAIHGTAEKVKIMHNGNWVLLDQRRLATVLKKDFGYKSGAIRLLSCGTGKLDEGFAQNLANKMGVKVKAPTDTLWIYSNGKMVIGPTMYKNTGKWKTFYPKKKGRS